MIEPASEALRQGLILRRKPIGQATKPTPGTYTRNWS